MLMRTLCRKTIKKGTPNSPMNGGQGVEVSKTLFYQLVLTKKLLSGMEKWNIITSRWYMTKQICTKRLGK